MEDETMNITSAVFAPLSEEDEAPASIQAVIDGQEMSVPMDPKQSDTTRKSYDRLRLIL